MAQAATERRQAILTFLAGKKRSEPILVRDVASACHLDPRQVRQDIKALAADDLVIRSMQRRDLISLGKKHTAAFVTVRITPAGREAARAT